MRHATTTEKERRELLASVHNAKFNHAEMGGHVEYTLQSLFDVINMCDRDYPFDDYADFYIYVGDAQKFVQMYIHFVGMFYDDEAMFDYHIDCLGFCSPYALFRVTKS